MHAEEAYQETGSDRMKRLTERIFRALTDTFTDPRGVRRPTSVAELAAICESAGSRGHRDRRDLPPARPIVPDAAGVGAADADVVVDLSHESLMRCWTRLITWAQQERPSTALYSRLSREATWYDEGAAGLWDDPELELGLRWRRENQPTAAWARRYGDSSTARWSSSIAASSSAIACAPSAIGAPPAAGVRRGASRPSCWSCRWRSAGCTASRAAKATAPSATSAWRPKRWDNCWSPPTATRRASAPTCRRWSVPPRAARARQAVLRRVHRPAAGQRAVRHRDGVRPLPARRDQPHARLRRRTRRRNTARRSRSSKTWCAHIPQNADHRQALANALQRARRAAAAVARRRAEAEKAYASALALQSALATSSPPTTAISRSWRGPTTTAASCSAASPNRTTTRSARPTPISARPSGCSSRWRRSRRHPQAAQELARVYNNLAVLLSQGAQDLAGLQAARPYYERADPHASGPDARDPRNREFKFELAKFSNNYAELLRELGAVRAAPERTAAGPRPAGRTGASRAVARHRAG